MSFPEPGIGGSYEEITWYKEQTGSKEYRIVLLHPSATGGKPLYYNEYCSDVSPCDSSSEGELEPTTGTFTIYNTQISDEGFYYYKFYINGGSASTGQKYEIELETYGEYLTAFMNLKEDSKYFIFLFEEQQRCSTN